MRFIVDEQTGRLVACPDCAHLLPRGPALPANALDRYGSDLGRASDQTFLTFRTTVGGQPSKVLQACLEKAREFASDRRGWLVIFGQSGNGKSHLAAAVRNYAVETARVPTIYITVPDLIYMLRRLFNQRNQEAEDETFEERLDVYRKAPLLILDDLGAEKVSEWSRETLYSILDYRYRLRLPTMITTNLNPYSHEDFDIRLVTRMTDAELCTVIENVAPNFRSRRPEER